MDLTLQVNYFHTNFRISTTIDILFIILGAGGGWDMFRGLIPPGLEYRMGQSLLTGGSRGGQACYQSTDERGTGGFGGGGGGCTAGGGGGGYAGK